MHTLVLLRLYSMHTSARWPSHTACFITRGLVNQHGILHVPTHTYARPLAIEHAHVSWGHVILHAHVPRPHALSHVPCCGNACHMACNITCPHAHLAGHQAMSHAHLAGHLAMAHAHLQGPRTRRTHPMQGKLVM